MPSSFLLTLDTLGPAGVAASIDAGAGVTVDRDVQLAVTTTDAGTVGYEMKVWGDVDPAFNAAYAATEGAAQWVAYASPVTVRVATGDGVKTLRVRLRDDVANESAEASDTITLDTTAPVVTVVVDPDPDRISERPDHDTTSFQWQSGGPFEEYELRVVPAAGSAHTEGVALPSTAGSVNVAGAAGGYPADTPITSTIHATDLKTAAGGDGEHRIKVFVRDTSGNWSVGP